MEQRLQEVCTKLSNDPSVDQETRFVVYMDILLGLLELIEGGSIHGPFSPETIWVYPDYRVRVEEDPNIGLLYSAPEVIFGGAYYSTGTQLFTLGLVLFSMLYHTDYYSAMKYRVLEIEGIARRSPKALIELPSDLVSHKDIPEAGFREWKEIMLGLTAWDAERRFIGEKRLLEMYNDIDSVNKVCFVDEEGEIVAHVKIVTKDDVKGFPPKQDELNIARGRYTIVHKIDIPYRPGNHVYQIPVRKIG